MSDTDKPDTSAPPPAPDKPAPPAAEVPGKGKAPGKADKGKKPAGGGGGYPRRRILEPIPSLEQEQRYASGPRIKDLDDEIAGELEAALAGLSQSDMLAADTSQKVRQQDGASSDQGRKQGKVISLHGKDVFIEVPGGRSQGVLPLDQFPDGPPKPGTPVDISIEGYDPANGLLILSRRGAAVVADWSSVAEGMTVEARVVETNKGGLAVDINGIRGFMPISQIDLYRVEQTDQFVGQKLLCLVTEVNAQERNLVVSRRALLERDREQQREKLWSELAEGQVRQGIVRSVRDFGAFVDLGGVDGLLHISEMSWKRVQDASSIVQPGQSIKVVVLKIDPERRKVSLGLKQLEASPWDNIREKYGVGQTIQGTVTRTMDFGAFVELEPGVEGLVHVSELARQRVWRVTDIVKPGQLVDVKILGVDPEQRRISLSLKAALPQEVAKPASDEEEDAGAADYSPPKPRNIPLRGGVGQETWIAQPGEPEEEEPGSGEQSP